jgi:hypothetical protein
VISRARRTFWEKFAGLPEAIQETARAKFALWRREPFHPSLHFKELRDRVWSVRINAGYRALGLREGELIVWFWVGSHDEYQRLIKK